MPWSLVSGFAKGRDPVGTRWRVRVLVSQVTSTGDYVAAATLGLTNVEHVQATAEDATVAIQAVTNSQNGSAQASPGDVYLKSASTTTDVYLDAVGRG